MKWISGSLALAAASLVVLPSCKKKQSERVASDLVEAGYRLTPEDWFRASCQNDVAVMKKFISAGFSPQLLNGEGDSALHEAAAGGAMAAADFLLDRKVPVDLRGASEHTPLMSAVLADQPQMVAWLLRQGADANLRDKEGFKPLMLAAREGKARCVGELASYNREDLDAALLLAAMEGRADVIDALTNHGASVYTRMEDGRTPLMLAAQNDHADAVKLLLEIGSSRFTIDGEGRTAAEIATAAGHPDIATLVSRDPEPTELALESPAEIAKAMDAWVDREAAPAATGAGHSPAAPIQGEILSSRVTDHDPAGSNKASASLSFAMPPLIMRHYREKEIPMSIITVKGDTATLRVAGRSPRDVKVKVGDVVAGSDLVVVRVQRRMEDSKVNPGRQNEISVVEVKDRSNGVTREWIAGFPSEAHDPMALVEDAATGKRYTASPGQKFSAADGAEYLVSEVRPNQLVIREVATGVVRTIPLRGPRG